MNKICIDCEQEFITQGKNHKRCGSSTLLTGCSGKRKIFLRSHYKDGRKRSLGQRPGKKSLARFLPLLPNNDKCAFCGTNNKLTVDHLIPRCVGGGDDLENMRVLCSSCNTKNFHSVVKKALRYYFFGTKE